MIFLLICLQENIFITAYIRFFVLSLNVRRYFSALKFTEVLLPLVKSSFLRQLILIFVQNCSQNLLFRFTQLITCPILLYNLPRAGLNSFLFFPNPHHHQLIVVQTGSVNTIRISDLVGPTTVLRVLHGCFLKLLFALAPVRASCAMAVARKVTSFEIALIVTGINAGFNTFWTMQKLLHIFYLTLTPMWWTWPWSFCVFCRGWRAATWRQYFQWCRWRKSGCLACWHVHRDWQSWEHTQSYCADTIILRRHNHCADTITLHRHKHPAYLSTTTAMESYLCLCGS